MRVKEKEIMKLTKQLAGFFGVTMKSCDMVIQNIKSGYPVQEVLASDDYTVIINMDCIIVVSRDKCNYTYIYACKNLIKQDIKAIVGLREQSNNTEEYDFCSRIIQQLLEIQLKARKSKNGFFLLKDWRSCFLK